MKMLVFYFVVLITIEQCASSTFYRFLKKNETVFDNVTNYDYPCVKINVTVSPKTYKTCAFVCAEPRLSAWGQMHEEIIRQGQLNISHLHCYYFTYDGDNVCTLGLTNPGLSLPEQQVEEGIVLGVSMQVKILNIKSPRCIEPKGGSAFDGVLLILTSACNNEHGMIWYEDGRVMHVKSGLCMAPADGSMNPTDGTRLVLTNCVTQHYFKINEFQSILQLSSGKCIHPAGGQPIEGVQLGFHAGCNDGGSGRMRFRLV